MAQFYGYDGDLSREITPLIPEGVNVNHGSESRSQFAKDSKLLGISLEKKFLRVEGDDDAYHRSVLDEKTESPLWRQVSPSRVTGEVYMDRNQNSLGVLRPVHDGTRFNVECKPHPFLCEGRLIWDVSVHPSKACVLLSKGKILDINSARIRFGQATVPPLHRMYLNIQYGDQRIPWELMVNSDPPEHVAICLLLEALHAMLQEPLDYDEWHCLDNTVDFNPGAIANKWNTHKARHLRLAQSSSPTYHISKEASALRRIDTLGNNTNFMALKPSYDRGGGVQNRWVVILGPKGHGH